MDYKEIPDEEITDILTGICTYGTPTNFIMDLTRWWQIADSGNKFLIKKTVVNLMRSRSLIGDHYAPGRLNYSKNNLKISEVITEHDTFGGFVTQTANLYKDYDAVTSVIMNEVVDEIFKKYDIKNKLIQWNYLKEDDLEIDI